MTRVARRPKKAKPRERYPRVDITLPAPLLQELDKKRGRVPRSAVIADALRAWIDAA